MKNIIKILNYSAFLVVCSWLLCACSSPERQAVRIETSLHHQQQLAERGTEQLRLSLEGSSLDSILQITRRYSEVLFFVFDHREMVYWSDNWLASNQVLLTSYDQWTYMRFGNAHTVGRWTAAGPYNILTVIPVKYAYPLRNEKLQNNYVRPFRADKQLQISRHRVDGWPHVHSLDGTFLFSVGNFAASDAETVEDDHLKESFSFRPLFLANADNQDTNWLNNAHVRARVFYILSIALYIMMFMLGLFVIVRYRGFRNMKLGVKFQFFVLLLVMGIFISIFVISVFFVRRNYEAAQQRELQDKCRYVQSALQNLYFWDLALTPGNTSGLNIDLRDLSYTYETDIHVYDINGNLVGSSTPMLFDRGIISRHMATYPFFSQQSPVTQYERIGDLRYLTTYNEFVNGNYMRIGYIALHSFISEDQRAAQVDSFVSRLLPPYLLALFLAVMLTFFFTRNITGKITNLAERMGHYHLGNEHSHLEYESEDEVGELVQRYNEMVDELELSTSRLARSERDAAWRTMARQIAHEINNPLTPMKLTIQQLRRIKGSERFDQSFDSSTGLLIEQIDNLSRIAQSFSTFAKMPEVKVANVDVAQKLTSTIELFRNNPIGVPIRYIGPDDGIIAKADPEQIAQVFSNIIKNALQALEDKADGDIIVIMNDQPTHKQCPGEQYVEIAFSDNGPGIPADVREKIFMPNFTTKSSGSGLGLAISKNIVEGGDGKICFQTSERGTVFLVYLRKI